MSKTESTEMAELGAYSTIEAATTREEKSRLARWAVSGVALPDFDLPVPPMFFDFPWAAEGEDAVDDILVQIVMADDLATAVSGRELRKVSELLGKEVVIHGAMARKGQIEDAKWGAYLTLTVQVDGAEAEVVHTSSPQIVTTVWLLYARGELPARGTFAEVAVAKKGQNAALGFRLWGEF
jgi:hypothetical protein